MNVTTRKVMGLAGVVITMACMGLTSPAFGAPDDGFTQSRTPRTVHIRGELIPIYGTPNYVVRGDLVGTWLSNTQPKPLHEAPTLYAEAGTEIFNGCIDLDRSGRCGRGDYRGQMQKLPNQCEHTRSALAAVGCRSPRTSTLRSSTRCPPSVWA